MLYSGEFVFGTSTQTKKFKEEDSAKTALKKLKKIAALDKEDEFKSGINSLGQEWRDDENSRDFEKYFEKQYLKQYPPQMWAQCYVEDGGPITNMALENFHKQLKHNELNGKPMVRLDVLIRKLIEFMEKAGLTYVHQLLKNPVIGREKPISISHEKAIELVVETQSESKSWLVQSTTDTLLKYEVILNADCDEYLSCLKCRDCLICYHSMSCSCADYRLGNICKHTHAVMISNPQLKAILPTVTVADQMTEMESRTKLRPSQSCGIPQIHINESGPDPILLSNIDDESTYASDDPNRLTEGLSKLSRGDRVKLLDKWVAELNRAAYPPANTKTIPQTYFAKRKK